MMDANYVYCNNFLIYVTIMLLYTSNLYSDVWQLFLSKTEGKIVTLSILALVVAHVPY